MKHAIIPEAISTTLSALPYALLLLYVVRRSISRAVLAFAIGVPAAGILLLLITTAPMLSLYFRNPVNAVMLAVPLVIEILIIVLAYQAQRSTGLMLPASSLVTALAPALVYFYALHLITRFIFRNFVR